MLMAIPKIQAEAEEELKKVVEKMMLRYQLKMKDVMDSKQIDEGILMIAARLGEISVDESSPKSLCSCDMCGGLMDYDPDCPEEIHRQMAKEQAKEREHASQ